MMDISNVQKEVKKYIATTEIPLLVPYLNEYVKKFKFLSVSVPKNKIIQYQNIPVLKMVRHLLVLILSFG
jgi:hypothetical protein